MLSLLLQTVLAIRYFYSFRFFRSEWVHYGYFSLPARLWVHLHTSFGAPTIELGAHPRLITLTISTGSAFTKSRREHLNVTNATLYVTALNDLRVPSEYGMYLTYTVLFARLLEFNGRSCCWYSCISGNRTICNMRNTWASKYRRNIGDRLRTQEW